jgi:epoxyqueuosine reductase
VICSAALKAAAVECGFGLVGLARAERLDAGPLKRWLAQGMAAGMLWMHRRLEERLDPSMLLAGCKTVVALGCCFSTAGHQAPSPIARYARGRDYHATLRDRLKALRRRVQALAPGAAVFTQADAGPLMEKRWAQRAGLGWIGKNSLLLTPEHGSQVVLAAMLLDRDADRYDAPGEDGCGSCEACLSACPTGAIVEPGVVDARRCLAYHTVESREPFPEELCEKSASTAFGCDACQDGCPKSGRAHTCEDPRFLPRPLAALGLEELAQLDRQSFEALTAGTAVRRATFEGLVRNALVALGARRNARAAPIARALAGHPDARIREAACWALGRPP